MNVVTKFLEQCHLEAQYSVVSHCTYAKLLYTVHAHHCNHFTQHSGTPIALFIFFVKHFNCVHCTLSHIIILFHAIQHITGVFLFIAPPKLFLIGFETFLISLSATCIYCIYIAVANHQIHELLLLYTVFLPTKIHFKHFIFISLIVTIMIQIILLVGTQWHRASILIF